jgi:hypothetical protein
VALAGADRGKHAQLAQPALAEHDEAGRGDQGDQQQDDRGQPERARGGGRLLGLGRGEAEQPGMAGRARLEPAAVASRQRGRPLVTGTDQQRHRPRRPGTRRRRQGELVVQVAGVLDQSHDGSRAAVEREHAADADLEGRRHRVGHRDLAGGDRVAALPERQHRRAVRPVRVLGPELDGLDRARHRHRPAADHLGRAEEGPNVGDGGGQPARVGLVEVETMVGRAEPGVG